MIGIIDFEMDEEDGETQFHPNSKWEEPWSETNLTMYDLHRKPRPIIEGNEHRLHVPMKTLNIEFVCPICLSYMRKTSIVMECLHRFCDECIQKCLRIGRKECPSCRTHIPSRRSLRADPEFDMLLKNILGNLENLEVEEAKQGELAKEKSRAMAESRKRGMIQQANQRNKKPARSVNPSPTPASSVHIPEHGMHNSQAQSRRQATLTCQKNLYIEPSPLVDFVLQRHPQETSVDRLKREWIRINEDATVTLIGKFLSQKLANELKRREPGDFEIYCRHDSTLALLDENVTLKMVKGMCEGDPIVLQYKLA